MPIIRQPIVVVMGHVDHGKTMLLDSIRSTSVHKREKGAITQHIGASEVPAEVLKEIGGSIMQKMKVELRIPGLLFIDTPGHEAFTNLRKRGGSIADIAVLVVDCAQGFQPQTLEAISILREYKTPFLVAMSKIDLIDGWKPQKTKSILESLAAQPQQAKDNLEAKTYELIGKLAESGFNADRFDRVKDYTKEVAIIPVSAKTCEGLSELLIMIAGLVQKFLEGNLHIDPSAPGRASILEVKDEPGLGKTLDSILYDGVLKVGDHIAFATISGPKITKVRAVLRPKPLDEMRDPRDKFTSSSFVSAAAGIKISGPELDDAIPGSALLVVSGKDDPVVDELSKEVSSILSFTQGDGVIVKADTLGSLEAAIRLLTGAGIRVGKVGIGAVSRKDVIDCTAVREHEKNNAVILAFNVKVPRDVEAYAKDCKIPIFSEGVIYLLIEKFFEWRKEMEEQDKRDVFSKLQPICRLRVLPGCCFRVSKPAICGVKVEVGRLRPGATLIDENGTQVGTVRSIQSAKVSVAEAKEGDEVALSVDEAVYGRDICEGKQLMTYVPKQDADLYAEKYSNHLSEEELALLAHILRITRQRLV